MSCLYLYFINSKREKQITPWMIPNVQNEGWQYLQVQKITALLRGITSKHDGDFYCLNFVLFFWTENKLKSHEKVCKNKGFGGIIILSQKDNILQFN